MKGMKKIAVRKLPRQNCLTCAEEREIAGGPYSILVCSARAIAIRSIRDPATFSHPPPPPPLSKETTYCCYFPLLSFLPFPFFFSPFLMFVICSAARDSNLSSKRFPFLSRAREFHFIFMKIYISVKWNKLRSTFFCCSFISCKKETIFMFKVRLDIVSQLICVWIFCASAKRDYLLCTIIIKLTRCWFKDSTCNKKNKKIPIKKCWIFFITILIKRKTNITWFYNYIVNCFMNPTL